MLFDRAPSDCASIGATNNGYVSGVMKTLFRNGLIFDGNTKDLLADRLVGITGGKIAHLSSDPWDETPDHVIDLRGRVLMPGLIDAHYHAYAGEGNFRTLEELPLTLLAHRARKYLEASLRRGFTSVRDAAGADYGLWRAIEEGYIKAPRLFFGGRALSQTGGHGDARPAHIGADPCHCGSMPGVLVQVVDGVESVRLAAREILRQGAHHVKIMASGGLSSPTDPTWMSQYTEDEIRAVVVEAQRWRRYVMAHAYAADTISRAVTCGVRSIEHGNFIDADAARQVAVAGAFVVPTLITYEDLEGNTTELEGPAREMGGLAEFRRRGLEAIEHCTQAGAKLGFGSDLFGDMHGFQSHELRIRGEVSTPFEVLRSATVINAELLQQADTLGCVKPNAIADLIVVDGNPLDDLSLLWGETTRISLVMKQGEIVHMAEAR